VEESLYDSSELIALRRSTDKVYGFTTIINLIEFPKAVELGELRVLYPTKEDYDTALVWSARLLELGNPIPATDLVIAAISLRLQLKLVTRDQHFRAIKSVAQELKLQLRHGN